MAQTRLTHGEKQGKCEVAVEEKPTTRADDFRKGTRLAIQE